MRRKTMIRAGILVVWLAFMAWILRYEAHPELFTQSLDGYRGLLSRDVPVMDSWMIIRFQGQPIGYSHTSMEVNDANPLEYHLVNNSVHLNFKALGTTQMVRTEVNAALNMLYELQTFTFNFSSPGYTLSVRARRLDERMFEAHWRTGHSSQLMNIEIPMDAVVYSPMTEMAVKRLRPGQAITLKTLDPTTMGVATVTLRALRTESLEHGGRHYETVVVATEYLGMRTLSWIDVDGAGTIRQETPFGWTFEAGTPDEAFAAIKASGKTDTDLLARMAVPVKGRIENPRGSRRLRLRLQGTAFEADALTSRRQHVERIDGHETILVVDADTVPDVGSESDAGWLTGEGPVPDGFKAYLEPSMGVESDHSDIVARARSLVAGRTDAMERAQSIFEWVYGNVEKEMTVSLPSALDVLRTMKGDCNEHTYLFVGLARAAGLPSKIIVGLAYHEGAFYYHAWPAVYVGRWLEMDPTWGQAAVDATHIALVEGDLSRQVEIVKVVGRLSIEVLEED